MSAGDVLLAQAQSQLARQEAALNTLRTQATAVFSASGVVAALFGPRVLTSAHISWWVTPALVLMVVGVIATVFVLTPRRLAFTERLDNWWGWLIEAKTAPDRDEALAIGLAKNLNSFWGANRDKINRLATWYQVLCVAFGLQVVAWVVATVAT